MAEGINYLMQSLIAKQLGQQTNQPYMAKRIIQGNMERGLKGYQSPDQPVLNAPPGPQVPEPPMALPLESAAPMPQRTGPRQMIDSDLAPPPNMARGDLGMMDEMVPGDILKATRQPYPGLKRNMAGAGLIAASPALAALLMADDPSTSGVGPMQGAVRGQFQENPLEGYSELGPAGPPAGGLKATVAKRKMKASGTKKVEAASEAPSAKPEAKVPMMSDEEQRKYFREGSYDMRAR